MTAIWKTLKARHVMPALLATASLAVVTFVASTPADARAGVGRPGVGVGRVGSGLGVRPGVGIGRAGIGVGGWRGGLGYGYGRGYGYRGWGYGAAALTGAALYGAATNYGYGDQQPYSYGTTGLYNSYGTTGLYNSAPGYYGGDYGVPTFEPPGLYPEYVGHGINSGQYNGQ